MDDKELEELEDEIIDLEDEVDDIEDDESVSEIEVPEESTVSQSPNITKRGNNYNPFAKGRISNSDKATAEKLKNLGNKNQSIPPLGGSSFSNRNNNEEEKEDTVKDKIQDKAVGHAITAATGGAVNGPAAEKLAEVARKSGLLDAPKKYKWVIIASIAGIIALFLIIFIIMIGSYDDTEMNLDVQSYINESMTEDELIKQLMYYGYCNTEDECKSKGTYKFFKELKDIHDKYSEDCNGDATLNQVCGVNINTALIIETANYYDNSISSYDSRETGTTEEEVENNKGQNIFLRILEHFKQQKRVDSLVSDVEALAKAQAEYVHEKCYVKEKVNGKEVKKEKNMYYYQISMDKYTSYLMYGDTSNHPNYSGKAKEVENDECVGPKDDTITTSYSSNNGESSSNSTIISGNGSGTEIVNYALQFVGNPYVWGGTSLTNGTDCSGFTQGVYGHFGISLPRHSADQINASGGTIIGNSLNDLDKAEPGDLLVWNGHVAIYMGNNQIVHAQSTNTGIVVSKVSSSHPFLGIVRFTNNG